MSEPLMLLQLRKTPGEGRKGRGRFLELPRKAGTEKRGGVPRQPPPPRAREREVGFFGVASVSVFICMFLACPWHTRCLSPPLLPPALIRTVV